MRWPTRHLIEYFLQLNRLLQSDPRPDTVLARAALQTAQFVNLSLVELYTLEDGTLRRQAGYPAEAGTIRIPLSDERSIAARAARGGATAVVAPVRSDSPIHVDVAQRLNLSAVVAVPLWDDGEVLGSMLVGWSHPGFHPDPDDIETLELIALQLGNALRLARRISQVESQLDMVRTAHDSTLLALSRAVEHRDYETRAHSERVTQLALRMSDRLGLPQSRLEAIRFGALLHDVGKIAIPDHILLKPGPLTEEEWRVMKTHPVRGWELIKDMPWVKPVSLNIVRHHHEHWDGSGYPDGLAGTDIPVEARLFSFVDAYDALRSDRPYRRALSHEEALAIAEKATGKYFCPDCLTAFVTLLGDVSELYAEPAA